MKIDSSQQSGCSSTRSCGSPFMPMRAILRSVNTLTKDNHLFLFTMAEGELKCRPGQFVQLWIPGSGECPISVCTDLQDGVVELCVRRSGRVTDALFKLREGDWVGLRGPYGNGFPLETLQGKNLCLVAGGLGIAPIRSLLQFVLNRREQFGKLILIYGMRHSADLLFRHEMKQLIRRADIDVYIGAEEIGGPEVPPVPTQLGRVTDILRIAAIDESFESCVCGPPVMYPHVIRELKQKGVSESQVWLSLERHMKCGVGKCGHCFIGGHFTCQEGPVFCLSELRFMPEVVECVNC